MNYRKVPREICAPSNCVFLNNEKVNDVHCTYVHFLLSLVQIYSHPCISWKSCELTKINNVLLILRFAETRRASLFRTFPQRSATLSPGSSARWRLFLCQGWSLLIEMRYFITRSFVSDWSRSPTASKCPRRFASTWRPTPRRFNNHRLNIVSPLQKMLRCWSRWWRSGATSHQTSRPPQQDLL